MAERPILFSGPMVRAILAGHKTQTRRILRLPPGYEHGEVYGYEGCHNGLHALACDPGPSRAIRCPYGAPGDRLWVRETWTAFSKPSHEYGECEEREGPPSEMPDLYGTDRSDVVYAADGTSNPNRWRPSIHMPRWASRLALEITGVRVERLQDIPGADVLAEGVGQPWNGIGIEKAGGMTPDIEQQLRHKFHGLWNDINGEGGWESNPWVWALSFRAVSP